MLSISNSQNFVCILYPLLEIFSNVVWKEYNERIVFVFPPKDAIMKNWIAMLVNNRSQYIDYETAITSS